jgi:sRNA-binding protein
VREAQRQEAGVEVCLVAENVLSLLQGGAMEAKAVCLDDEAELLEVEVDSVAVHLDLGLGLREAGAPADREEALLELAVGEDEGVAVE